MRRHVHHRHQRVHHRHNPHHSAPKLPDPLGFPSIVSFVSFRVFSPLL
jgi:hypothetical protein